MKRSLLWPVLLWSLQALTGGLLVIYVVVHAIDNAAILLSEKNYEDMLALWHKTLPHWFYVIMVLGLVAVFLAHALNGIRITSKPYKEIDVSWRHNVMLRHSGTLFWYAQVLTGSAIAMFGIWHLLVQHGTVATTTALQSADRVTPTVFTMYVLFLAALMFHSFNGVRSVTIKLGFMTDKAKEGVLVGLMGFLFIVFFVVGVMSMARFLPAPQPDPAALHSSAPLEKGESPQPPGDLPIFSDTKSDRSSQASQGPGDAQPSAETPKPRGDTSD